MEQFENFEELDIRELWFIFVKNFKLIVIITLICMILVASVSFFFIDKQYESYTTLMLGKPKDYSGQEDSTDITYNQILLNQKLVTTYREIMKSKVITSKVIESLDLDITPSQLGNIISVTTLNDTEIIKITVKYTDPVVAANISNETAVIFMDYVSNLMNIDNVNVIDIAEVVDNPIAPNVVLNIAISFVLGLMLGVFIVFLREYLNTKIKSAKEIESLSKYPILAAIPKSNVFE
ncbi:MAG: YveK family protein [Eubacteriaceae bacterium]